MLSCLFIAALWSPAGKGLNSWRSCIYSFVVFLSLSHVVYGLGVVLVASIPDLCLLTYFYILHACHATVCMSGCKTNHGL